MPSTVGQWLIVILALLVGLAAGWVVSGWRARTNPVRPIVEGDPVAGVTDLDAEPPMRATVDQQRPEVTLDETPPAAVTVDATPVETEAAPAAATLAAAATPVPEVEPASATTGAVSPPTTGAVDTAPLAETSPAADAQTADRGADDLGTTESADAIDVEAAPGDARVPAAAAPSNEVTAGQSDTDADPSVLPAQRTDEERVGSAADEEKAGATADEEKAGSAADEEKAGATADEEKAGATADVERVGATADEDAPAASTSAVPAGAVPAPRTAVHDSDPATAPAADGPADDFRRIQGVGPKMAAALQSAGIRTYGQLAALDEAALRETIRAAGLRAAPSLATWAQQAKLLAGAPAEAERVLPVGTGAEA
ncbi:Predicted 5' DNA nuclease, flap endonuclease-1-like, helix-3-turn-helix (H3TH) domain [Micromonospora siamensis]|uniref:Predicted 5' DNA nuclease, flap endonuclease-1-like, helix-3-turn-helix (H3TH) domain n=1 Tax=Micromonospora siamensis TaxID=299152 RepID=A0A1C5IWS0_9ACTN|nr:Predicted 5' DNA nuclease, flap endonuclease-1-like, helix-3-turn-helix (H3TH) domain [Micromonospora siamensis]